jgi:hypothetical protein
MLAQKSKTDDLKPLIPVSSHARMARHIIQERQALFLGGVQGPQLMGASPTHAFHQTGSRYLFPQPVKGKIRF